MAHIGACGITVASESGAGEVHQASLVPIGFYEDTDSGTINSGEFECNLLVFPFALNCVSWLSKRALAQRASLARSLASGILLRCGLVHLLQLPRGGNY